jgi:hypothetical protein
MNIKNKLVAVVALAALVLPGITLAQSLPPGTPSTVALQAQIAALLAQIQTLQSQLNGQGGTTTATGGGLPAGCATTSGYSSTTGASCAPAASCYTFTTNLSIGMSGAGVTALQTDLQKDGEQVRITGSFDDQTAAAITSFQEKYASQILAPYGLSNGTGYAGKSTRAELNLLFGCGTTKNPPIACPAWGCNGPQPIHPVTPVSSVLVTQNTGLPSASITAGSVSQMIGSYILSASNTEGVVINTISINAGQNATIFQNLRLMVNGTQFGTTQPILSNNAVYAFSGPAITIPAGMSLTLNVYADVSVKGVPAGTADATTFTSCAAAGQVSYGTYTCNSVVGQTMTIGNVATGGPSLSVTVDPNAPTGGGVIVQNSTGNVLGMFDFSENSNSEATKINSLNVVDVVANNTIKAGFRNMSLYNGTTLLGVASAPVLDAGGTGYIYHFNFANPVVVPQNASIALTLKGDAGSYQNGSITDGAVQLFEIITTSDSGNNTASSVVNAVGASSNQSAVVSLVNSGNTNPQIIVRTILNVSAQSVSTWPTTSMAQLGSITLTANVGGNAVLNYIALTSSQTNSAFMNSLTLKDANGNNVATMNSNNVAVSGNKATWSFSPNPSFIISAGSSYTFTVWGNMTDIPAIPNIAQSLAISIANNYDFGYEDGVSLPTALGLPTTQVPLTVVNVTSGIGGGTSTSTTSPTITLFGSKDPNPVTGAVTISWQASAATDAVLNMNCTPGSVSFTTDQGNAPTCAKGGVWQWTGQNGGSIVITPAGNSSAVTVPFTLMLEKNGVPTGQSQAISVTFPAAQLTSPTVTLTISPSKISGMDSAPVTPGEGGVDLLNVDLTAGASSNVTLNTVNLSCGGYACSSGVTNLRLEEVVVNGQAISAQTWTGSVSNPQVFTPNLAIPAGETVTMAVYADIPANAPVGQQMQWSLYPGSGLVTITPTGNITGSAQGNLLNVAAAPTSIVTQVVVSVSSPYVSLGGTVQCSVVVNGTGNPSQNVTWTAIDGTINTSGLFTATTVGPGSCIARSQQNAADGGSAAITVTAPTSTPAPTVNISVNPTTINQGDDVEIQWSSTNAQNCTMTNGSRVWNGTNSEDTDSPSATTTYTETCSGIGTNTGTVSASATVNVIVPPPPAAGQMSLSASSISILGTNTTATETVTNTGPVPSELDYVVTGYPVGISTSIQRGGLQASQYQNVVFTYSSAVTGAVGNGTYNVYFYPVSISGTYGTPTIVPLTIGRSVAKPILPPLQQVVSVNGQPQNPDAQTAVMMQSLQGLLNQLTSLLKSL